MTQYRYSSLDLNQNIPDKLLGGGGYWLSNDYDKTANNYTGVAIDPDGLILGTENKGITGWKTGTKNYQLSDDGLFIDTNTTGTGIKIGDVAGGDGWNINGYGLFSYSLNTGIHAFCSKNDTNWQQVSSISGIVPIDTSFKMDSGDAIIGCYNYKYSGDDTAVGGLFWDQFNKQLNIRGALVIDSNIDFSQITGPTAPDPNADVTDYDTIDAQAQAKADAAQAAAQDYSDNNFVYTVIYNDKVNDLQGQIDGNITTWFYPGIPTLTNDPTVNWATTTDKDNHLGDLYYDSDSGYAYRFKVDTGIYSWQKISDVDVTAALTQAQAAQDTADHKRRVFVDTPTVPYDKGDLWDTGDGLKRSKVNQTTAYTASDWIDVADVSSAAFTRRFQMLMLPLH